jgi:hypothetical protein
MKIPGKALEMQGHCAIIEAAYEFLKGVFACTSAEETMKWT